MSQVVQYQKNIDDAFEVLRRSRQQNIVTHTPGRELPPSKAVAPLTDTELLGRLQKQAEADRRVIQDDTQYFEGPPPDFQRFPEYRPLFGKARPELSEHKVRLLEYVSRDQQDRP